MSQQPLDPSLSVAIVGMSGRFPGASGVAELWERLRRGEECISFFSREDLAAAGVEADLAERPEYVPARGALQEIDRFDAEFFGFSPREASLMDPQLRIFLECAWEALEDGAVDPERYDGPIGVFAGVSTNTYLLHNLLPNRALLREVGSLQMRILNDKDFLSTWASYRLNLRGPSITVQTACSTSLVAVHLACQSLLAYECEAALAGGVTVAVPNREGYLHEPGSIFSDDGHCRPFAAGASGTVGGSGAGLVLLKRLERALEDGDPVYAVIRGSATNNDGALKVGFTAPSVEGQAEVIAAAQSVADVEPESIGYIEAHGTGTTLGDPVEVEALSQVFREQTEKTGFCALGSVKSNVGHLDQAAGVTGLIKAALALQEECIPPSLHFDRPNPQIDFERTPFFVNSEEMPWPRGEAPRRAGISSFGVGGTNAHVILEEAPERAASEPGRGLSLLTLSAGSASALEAGALALAQRLAAPEPGLEMEDVAFTLQLGRRPAAHRRVVLAADPESAQAGLRGGVGSRVVSGEARGDSPSVLFLFPGEESFLPGMLGELLAAEPRLRECLEEGLKGVEAAQAGDLLALLQNPDAPHSPSPEGLRAAAFLAGYSLARLWRSWGVEPAACLGWGAGHLAAACVGGVLSPGEGLRRLLAGGQPAQAPAALDEPRVPWLSGVTGEAISRAAAGERESWREPQPEELRETLARLKADPSRVLLAAGPGMDILQEAWASFRTPQESAALVRSLPGPPPERMPATVPTTGGQGAGVESLLLAVARLWTLGVEIDWSAFHARRRRRERLPTYRFDRHRFWIEPPAAASEAAEAPEWTRLHTDEPDRGSVAPPSRWTTH